MEPMPTRFPTRRLALVLAITVFATGITACARSVRAADPLGGGPPASDKVARGKWLVTVLGCGDCHTPRLPEGRQDPNYLLAGHKENDPYPSWDDSLYTKGYG